jgi:hypothetical protein
MKVVVKQNSQAVVTAVGIPGPSGTTTIKDASDFDKSNLQDGALLIYRADIDKITTTKLLNQQVIEAGQY